MVLVAAIAAGVLINTAGFLQSKSEQTGQDSSAQVSNRMVVVSGFGNVTTNEDIDRVNLTVMRGAGSDDINLEKATVEWIGPNAATTLTYGDTADASNFTVGEIKDPDGSSPVLNSQDDRLEVVFNTSAIGGELTQGETVELKLTTQYGAVTIYRISVPQSLSDKSAVSV
jgi:flagellin FlaA/flagellin FlaB